MRALDGIYLKGLVEGFVKFTQGRKFQKKGQILIFRYFIYRSIFYRNDPLDLIFPKKTLREEILNFLKANQEIVPHNLFDLNLRITSYKKNKTINYL